MKSSNPQVMVQAYRLLVKQMLKENMNYPLHLGVTEAGDGEDGRIKSSLGIGTLLEEGLGDTIRVSLTEEPEYEIPVCKTLVNRYTKNTELTDKTQFPEVINPFVYTRRESITIDNLGGKNVPVVILTADEETLNSFKGLRDVGYYYSETLDKWNIGDMAPDFIYLGSQDINYKLPGTLKKIFDYEYWLSSGAKNESYPVLNKSEYLKLNSTDFNKFVIVNTDDFSEDVFNKLVSDSKLTFILNCTETLSDRNARNIAEKIISQNIKCPVVIKKSYANLCEEEFLVYPATDIGGLLIDGFGDGIWLESDAVSKKIINSISFGILQASRTRISKTEYISCPSCGRTLFDLQETTAKVREKTNHLKGLKIGIMGCIVNGPGEMADADYGYVGSGVGKITLYKGKEVVKRSIDSEVAVDELINLIKENNDWVEPE